MKSSTIFSIWKNKGQILEGIKNSVFKKEDVEKVVSQRMNICKSCDYLDAKGEHCKVLGTQPCCASCGCSLALKTRSLSAECPKDFWGAEMTKHEENLLLEKLQ